MAKEYSRTQRVTGQLQREIALIVHNEIKDPRRGFITISAVELSRDLVHAKVFFTLLDPEESHRTLVADILNRAAGFIRHQLGQAMRMRIIPQLHFQYDSSIEHGCSLSALIDKAVAADHLDTAAEGDKERD
ncbi:MAG: ribosome-binding factor A [Halothiobacillaceae bacterium]|nr:MAG: ribosome-binding factor A [Halothiobacillaceae bacterium]